MHALIAVAGMTAPKMDHHHFPKMRQVSRKVH